MPEHRSELVALQLTVISEDTSIEEPFTLFCQLRKLYAESTRVSPKRNLLVGLPYPSSDGLEDNEGEGEEQTYSSEDGEDDDEG